MRNLTLVLLATFVFTASNAQISDTFGFIYGQMSNSIMRYDSFLNITNKYFETNNSQSDTAIRKLSKTFARWNYFWEKRIGVTTSTGSSIDYDYSYTLSKKVMDLEYLLCESSPYSNTWTSLGPNSLIPAHISIVTAVAQHPTNPNIIYCGTKFSGLWKLIIESGSETNTWENITDVLKIPGLGISTIAINPSNPDILLVGTGAQSFRFSSYGVGILKITESSSGRTISRMNLPTQTNKPTEDYKIESIKFSPTNSDVIYAVGNKFFYKTTDAGSTWSSVKVIPIEPDNNYQSHIFNELRDLEISNSNSDVLFVSSDNFDGVHYASLFVSTDGGDNWTEKTPHTDYVGQRLVIDVTSANTGVIYAAFRNRTNKRLNIVSSTNNGDTWTDEITPVDIYSWTGGGLDHNKFEFEVSENSATNFYLGGDEVYRKIGTGSFTTVSLYVPGSSGTTHADIRAMTIKSADANNDILLIGHDGGISISNNSGSTWTNLNYNGLCITQFHGFDDFESINNDGLAGGTQDNGTFLKNNSTWSPCVSGSFGDGGITCVNNTNPSIVYGQSNSEVLASTNGGSSYTSSGNFASEGGGLVVLVPMPMQFKPNDYDELVVGVKNIWKHTSSGWSIKFNNPATPGTAYHTRLSALAIAPSNSDYIYFALKEPLWGINTVQKKLFKTVDGGVNITDITTNVSSTYFNYHAITDIEIDPANKNHLIISFDGYDETGNNRVFESTNGGTTWNDISEGLPRYPVNCLKYQEGSNDIIYAGTDAGVYVWNKEVGEWYCYNANMPPAIITAMEINYCTNKLKASTYGRGIWETDIVPITEPYHITSDQTCGPNTFHSFACPVVVDPGVTLTINGKVTFAENMWLSIEKTAKVNIVGGELYNACGEWWGGIHVAGDKTLSQNISTLNQGYLYMYEAKIRNAIVAVSTAAFNISNTNGTIDWSKTGGGIIIAKKCTLQYNKRHVEFMEYKAPGGQGDKSQFIECDFLLDKICDGSDADCVAQLTMITAWGVKGVRFTGCNYKNVNSSIPSEAVYADKNRGTGIYSLDASLIVQDVYNSISCTTTKKGNFRELTHGILSDFSSFNPFTGVYKKQDFDRTDWCITLNNGIGTSIHHNDFDLYVPDDYYNRAYSSNPAITQTGIFGILTNGSAGFHAENNLFHLGTGSANGGEVLAAGIFADVLSGGNSGIFRNNTIADINIGSQTQRNNPGLDITCNEFNGLEYGLNLNPWTTNSVTPYFGECDPLNQNKRVDYNNSFISLGIDGYHYPSNTKTYVIKSTLSDRPSTSNSVNIDCNNCSFLSGNNNVNPKNCDNNAAFNDPCSRDINPSDHTGFVEIKYNKGLKEGLLTDGNNSTLKSMVIAVTSSNVNNVYDALMQYSPYLSDEVLLLMLQYGSVFTHQQLANIIVANSALTDEVLTAVNSYGFLSPFSDDIEAAQEIIPSGRAQVENDLRFLTLQFAQARNEIVWTFNYQSLHDTVNNYVDSIIDFLSNESDLESRKMLVAACYNSGCHSLAASTLSEMDVAEGDIETEYFIEYYTLLLAVNDDERNIFQLTEGELDDVAEIAASETNAASAAKGLLTLVQGEYFEPFIEKPEGLGKTVDKGTQKKRVKTNMQSVDRMLLETYPNPADNSIRILYQYKKYSNSTSVRFTDIAGKILIDLPLNKIAGHFDINTVEYSNGVYFIQMLAGTTIVGVSKIIVQH